MDELNGRACVVTGASSGIGLATATELARRGATVALVVRSRERGEAARARIRQLTGSDATRLVVADLSLQSEVRRAADELRAAFPSLHLLVNNAGVYTARRHYTAERVEQQFAVNHLAPFLLTHLLLPALKAGAPARVVAVSSNAHHQARFDLHDLGMSYGLYRGFRQYANTKLYNLLFTRELARRTEGSGVTAWAAHPGVVATPILLNGFPPLRLFKRFMRTPEQGAATVVHLATASDLAAPSGSYFQDSLPTEVSAAARDPESARLLWEVSAGYVGLQPGRLTLNPPARPDSRGSGGRAVPPPRP